MNMNKPARIVAHALQCLGAIWFTTIAAAAYPERPIRIVVPLPAGTSPDLFARHLGQKLSASLKQPVIIETRPGANSVIGTGMVAKASADGYTLLDASVQHVMLKPLLGNCVVKNTSAIKPNNMNRPVPISSARLGRIT